MTRFRYIRHGVKRKYGIIECVLPLLGRIYATKGVEKVVPALISHSTARGTKQLELRFQWDTPSGFKLLAHSKRSIHEIFVVVTESKKEEVKSELELVKGLFEVQGRECEGHR